VCCAQLLCLKPIAPVEQEKEEKKEGIEQRAARIELDPAFYKYQKTGCPPIFLPRTGPGGGARQSAKIYVKCLKILR
jgi:hypothetical protein